MALLFRTELGGGSSIEPYTVIVSLDKNFEGQPVTLTQGTEIMRKTCPMIAPYEVEFKPMNDGVWVASSTTKDGKVVSVDTEPLLEWGTYNVTLKSDFNLREWLNRGRVEKTFTSLDDVLADEPTVRQLMTVHDSVDYLVTALSNDADTAQTILDNDICAKWINLRDYALDMLYANANVKAVMDSVDKYGYGEWALIGQVPKMTSNTAPSGEVFGGNSSSSSNLWKAFNQDPSDTAAGFSNINEYWIGYDFTKDVKINSVTIRGWVDGGKDSIKDFNIECSSDKINWEIVYSGQHTEVLGYETFTFDNDKSRRYWRIKCTSGTWAGSNTGGISVLQFYAWGAKGAVPVMTSNTAPYGEVIYGTTLREKYAYNVFDRTPTEWRANNTNSDYIGYKFVNPTKVTMIKYLQNFISDGVPRMPSFTIYATNNGTDRVNFTDWDKLTNSITAETTEGEHYYKFNNDNYYLYYVLVIPMGSGTIGLEELQFYGRQLNVSVPKMDNYTTPFGEVIELGYIAGNYEGYRAFDNDLSTYWQSNTDYTGMICYNFEKEVLVKNMYSIMKTPNTGVSKLEGSNTGNSNDWHPIYSDNITAGYPNTKSVLINGNLTYKYYRATITRTDDVPQVTELQFYGLDYSEKEFEEGSTMKYIYDHGVKLKTIETSISNGGTIDEQSDQILLVTNNKKGVTMLGAKVDVTNKKVARARFGLQAYTNASDENMGFMILNNTLAWNAPFNAVKTADMPNNANVNFASGGYSGEYYVIFGVDFTGTYNVYNTLQELWVE